MNFDLCGVPVSQIEAFRVCPAGSPEGLVMLTTMNAEILLLSQKNKEFRDAIISQYSTIAADGQWILFALRRKYGKNPIVKNSGSDLIYSVVSSCVENQKNILLLGGSELVNCRAVNKLRSLNGTEKYIYGYSPPFSAYPFSEDFSNGIAKAITDIGPDVIITAFGVPKQEFWARENKELLEKAGVRYVLFFGGAIDMVAGEYRRAPRWLVRAGLEGVYRLLLQPSRIKRYYKLLWLIPMIVFNRL